MSDPHPCDAACPLECPESACAARPADVAPIDLAEARECFRHEAVQGTVDLARYRMPYYSWGEGPPLVFVHGVCDSSQSFLMPISRLSAHFRCIAYDQPDTIRRGQLRRYTHDQLVEDLFALLDHLGLSRTYALGSSFGTTIVLAALYRQPQRLPRAVLQAGLARRQLRRAEWLLAWLGRWLPGMAGKLPMRDEVLERSQKPLFEHRAPEVWDYFLECTARPTIASFACQVMLLHRLDLVPLLPAIRQPVLLVCGDRDRVVPPAFQEVLLAGLPNAGRVVLEGCGHTPSFTHPEVYAEVVRQFLTPVPAATR